MATGAPPWIRNPTFVDDTSRYTAMTPEERLEAFVEVCRLAETILEERPDRADILARVDPMPPRAEQRWLELVAEARRARQPR